jgi:hypothetical protein
MRYFIPGFLTSKCFLQTDKRGERDKTRLTRFFFLLCLFLDIYRVVKNIATPVRIELYIYYEYY